MRKYGGFQVIGLFPALIHFYIQIFHAKRYEGFQKWEINTCSHMRHIPHFTWDIFSHEKIWERIETSSLTGCIMWIWEATPGSVIYSTGCPAHNFSIFLQLSPHLVGGLVAINLAFSQKYWVANHPN